MTLEFNNALVNQYLKKQNAKRELEEACELKIAKERLLKRFNKLNLKEAEALVQLFIACKNKQSVASDLGLNYNYFVVSFMKRIYQKLDTDNYEALGKKVWQSIYE